MLPGSTHVRAQVRAFGFLAMGLALGATSSSAAPQSWSQQPGTDSWDRFLCVTGDGAGGVYCGGMSQGSLFGPNSGWSDVVLARYDANGQLLLSVQYGSSDHDRALGLALDGAGGVFVAGSTDGDLGGPSGGGGVDGFLSRVDAAGNVLWTRQFGNANPVLVAGVVADGAGGCFVAIECTGFLWGAPLGSSDVALARFDASGNYVWTRTLGTGLADGARFVESNGQGGVIVGGSTAGALGGPDQGMTDAWYGNIDPNGNVLWLRQFGTPDQDVLMDAGLDGSGEMLLVGETSGSMVAGTQLGKSDIFLARVDGSGNFLWVQQYGSTEFDHVLALTIAPTGVIYAGGMTMGNFGGPHTAKLFELWIGRFDVDGSSLGVLQKSSGPSESTEDLIATATGGVIAAGVAYGSLWAPGTQSGATDAWAARFEVCDFEFASNYCSALPNSSGKSASISHQGTRVVSLNNFVLAAEDLPTFQLGLFLMGPSQASTPFGNGTLCVGGGILRLLPAVGTGPGVCALALDFTDPGSNASQIDPGETWSFQFWFRDVAAGGAAFNLSDGLSATFYP
jgi:hypothetical protein